MLHIDGGVYIDSGLEQFFHVLIPLCVPASWSIVVSQFIYQNELGLALKGLIKTSSPCKRARVSGLAWCST